MFMNLIHGYSKLSQEQQFEVLVENKIISAEIAQLLKSFWYQDPSLQKIINGISENSLSNYVLPLSIVPNVLVNKQLYAVPVVTEESSVVAAASFASKFWAKNGGFKTEVKSVTKIGQIHFIWRGNYSELQKLSKSLENYLKQSVKHLTTSMDKRGGGIEEIKILDFTSKIENCFQIQVSFNTADAMGANFINSCLETMARNLVEFISEHFNGIASECNIIMAILSNYTPECKVECTVECSPEKLLPITSGLSADDFINKFETAIKIAQIDPYRAVTHNKGIFNGIDAVVLATGNDFRAIEACGHAYASRNGMYSSLSWCENTAETFRFKLEIPLSLGSVGGLTNVHPMANVALKILKQPSATELMQITAAVGMSNHFSAIRALVTNGIQRGHMKMHLTKILQHFKASDEEKQKAVSHFKNNEITYHAVSDFILQERNKAK